MTHGQSGGDSAGGDMSEQRLVDGVHHVGVVVSSLDASIAFYQANFGGEVELILRDTGGPQTAELHGLPAARFDLAFLRYGPTRVELFEFHEPPGGAALLPAANVVGSSHIAFEVDDIDAAYERLVRQGVAFTRPPHREGAPGAQFGLAFCADPDGNRIELISPPKVDAPARRPASLVSVSIRPEARDRFEELLARVVEGSAAEPGTQEYTVHVSGEDQLTYWIYERYDDEDALAAHRQMPALAALLAELGELLSGPPQIIELATVDAAA
jgi:quinol monooxygenase YgiN/catechol 2,3-dioxygenase-like lactoylglutathione lyase family enzyme